MIEAVSAASQNGIYMPQPTQNKHQDEFQADDFIKKHGTAAIPRLLELIRDAVRAGDDEEVSRWDRMMRVVEEKTGISNGRYATGAF